MITIISGSNRQGNLTLPHAKFAKAIFEQAGEKVNLIDLVDLPREALTQSLYTPSDPVPFIKESFDQLQKSDLWFIVAPEYNGSFPGSLKVFIDGLTQIDYPRFSQGKYVGLMGVAAGRAGNLRGLDHLASIFMFTKAQVLPGALPISGISNKDVESGELINENTKKSISNYVKDVLSYVK